MSDIEEAYRSLDKVKRERQELIEKVDSLEIVHNILKPYCEMYVFSKYRSVREEIDVLRKENKSYISNMVTVIILYFLGLGFTDLISVLLMGNINGVVISVFAFIALSIISVSAQSKPVKKNNKKIKELRLVEQSLGNSLTYSKKSIKQLVDLIKEAIDIYNNDIDDLNQSIEEYEDALAKANEDLASTVLLNNGIEASVSLNSSMKVLSKRYEAKK